MQLERQGGGRYSGGARQPEETDMIYAVNKRTKEHRLYDYGDECSEYHDIIQADADGWIEWNGGECPLSDGSRFDAKTRGGTQHPGCRGWRWDHKDVVSDIIAYRPILDDKPQPPEWNGEGLPPVGGEANTLGGTVLIKGYFGSQVWYQRQGGGDVVQMIENAQLSPMPTKRDRWIEAAHNAGGYNDNDLVRKVASQIYDALKSGELPQP